MAAKKTLKHWVEYLSFQLFLWIVRLIPLQLGNWLGRRLGALAYRVLKSRRELTLENLREAQQRGFLPGDLNIEKVGLKTWEHLGMIGSEFLFYFNRPRQVIKNISFEGEANLQQVLAKKRGVIMATGHIGNWEIMGTRLSLAGICVNSITKTQTNSLLDEYINHSRQAAGIKCIPKLSFLRPILRAFERNELVSFFMDQNAGRHGVPVAVFGRETMIPRGTAEFALKTGTPVVFGYIVREAKGRHRLVISEEISLSRSGDYEADLAANTAKFTELIQAIIRKYPEQWLWMHKLWTTKIKV